MTLTMAPSFRNPNGYVPRADPFTTGLKSA
jgi:hypothetical protein